MGEKKESKLRGRFTQELGQDVQRYLTSLPFDWRLYAYDIEGSLAHAAMLARQKIISQADYRKISRGLKTILGEIESGDFVFKLELQDIHMNIEGRLHELIGDVAGKLHTARSRNDQVVLDTRLYARDAVYNIIKGLSRLNQKLVDVAEENVDVIMPGYTHMQQAQPILFAHHMLAYFEMFNRDRQRFQDCLQRINVLPLGSGAIAGLPYPVDRDFVAKKLGFTSVSGNSIDAVSDRDFVIELESAAAIAMMHISRLSEELIIWSGEEFHFIEIGDDFTTSSSIMPQKKNPDVAELARGKAGRVYGNLMGILTVMKGLPLAYNSDMQEDKEGLFDCVDTLISSLDVMAGLVRSIKVNQQRMKSVMSSYILATDIADYLVSKGLSFRKAHDVVSRLIAYAIKSGREISQLDLKEFRNFSGLFDRKVYDIDLRKSVEARASYGGTAPAVVKQSIERAKRIIQSYETA